MAKNVKVLEVFPDGFINCTYTNTDTQHSVTIAVPPAPENIDGSPQTEDDVLNYLADQWPDNEFVERISPAMNELVGTTRGLTARIVQRDIDRGPPPIPPGGGQGQP